LAAEIEALKKELEDLENGNKTSAKPKKG